MTVQSVQEEQRHSSNWSEPLSPEEQEQLKQRVIRLKQLLDEEKERREKYKIEVVFDKRKTTRGAFPGSVMLLRSGSALSGEGDEPVYPCESPGLPRCPGLIPPENVSTFLEVAVCPVCGYNTPRDQLTDATFYRLDPEHWSYVLAREFHRCNCDASIYMKTAGVDLRTQSQLELARPQQGDALRTARKSRSAVMYERYRILQDISTGASLEKQLKALITA
jgi:hypothetical protein